MATLAADVGIEYDGNHPPSLIQVKAEVADTYFRGGLAHHTAGLLQLTPTAAEEFAGVVWQHLVAAANDLVWIAITGRYFYAFAGALDADFNKTMAMPAADLTDNPASLVVSAAGTAGAVGTLDHVTSTGVSGWVNIDRRAVPVNS